MQEELNWVYPSKTSANGYSADITIFIGKPKDGYEFNVSMTIKNGCYKKLSTTDRVQMAVSGDRLYFRGAGENEKGYKMTKAKNETTRYISFTSNVLGLPKETLLGAYKLQFDHQRRLPYIRLDKKL